MSADSHPNVQSANEIVLSGLADEFVERLQRGEQPTIEEYTDKHPQLAAEIREIFPMLGFMKQVGDQTNALGPASFTPQSSTVPPRSEIGEYKIIREIGRGGMGVVYEAEHATLNRRVALKMLPECAFGQHQKDRFYREARAAARLHHTNIVPVFDVGEEDGVPYFAMQYIDGRGLDELVDWAKTDDSRISSSGSLAGFWQDFATATEESASSSREHGREHRRWRYIARLGIQAADALQYAHSHGVFHRDIKPSNMLLDKEHHVWITDFGLAKQTDDQDLTATGDIVGTLRYMSPEAIRGDLDARGDVYSLGLVLYELIVLRRPFDDVDRLAVMRQITDSGPRAISQLRLDVPRDLVTIVDKAIERDPRLRYQSARKLRDDLLRFVKDEPIMARQTSLAGRWWRWAKRNRALAAVTTSLLVVVVAGFVGSSLAAWRLAALSNRLQDALLEQQQRTAEAEAATEFMVDAFRKASPREQGQNVTVASVLDDAIVGLDERFSEAPLVKLRLLSSFGETYDGLGLQESSESAYRSAWELARQQLGDEHPESIRFMSKVGNALIGSDPAAALQILEKSLALSKQNCGPDDAVTLNAEASLARTYVELDRFADAIPLIEHVLESVAGPDAAGAMYSVVDLANAYLKLGKVEEALKLAQEARERAHDLFGEDHHVTLMVEHALAIGYQHARRDRDAIELHEVILQKKRRKLGENHLNTLSTLSQLALSYRAAGELDKSLQLQKDALERKKLTLGSQHLATLSSMLSVALELSASGEIDQAIPLVERVVALRKAKLGDEHSDTLNAQSTLASIYQRQGRYEDALKIQQPMVDAMARVMGQSHPHTLKQTMGLALTLKYLARYPDAIETNRRVLSIQETTLGAEHPDSIVTLFNLAACYRSAGDVETALQHYEPAYSRSQDVHGPTHPMTLACLRGVGVCLGSLGRHEEAVEIGRKSVRQHTSSLGAHHPATLTARKHLASALMIAGQSKAALLLYTQVIRDMRSVHGENNPTVLETLSAYGTALVQAGQLEEAVKVLRETLAARRTLLGNHPKTVRTMLSLGEALEIAGKYDEAEPFYEEALNTAEADQLATKYIDAGYDRLCHLHLARGAFAEAEEIAVKWLATFENDEARAVRAELHACLAEAKLGQAKLDQAIDAAETSLALLGSGDVDAVRARANNVIGSVLAHRRDWQPAETRLLESHEQLHDWVDTQPRYHWLLVRSAERLAHLYGSWRRGKQAQHWNDLVRELTDNET